MDAERRRALQERRVAMQGRIDRERQRGALWGEDGRLIAAGARFTLHYRDDAERIDWLAGMVPSGAFHLRWDALPGAISNAVFEEERAAFARVILEAIAPEAPVYVVPGNGLAPILEFTRAEFDRHAERLVDIDREMWLSGAPHWLIEFRKWEMHAIGLPQPEDARWHRKRDEEPPAA
ncbi:hypothetical protein [Stakelama tenebrarum]|uniref:Uncharacterized protein n=1 Tax=Stakelama tenebrarum TaxID=2711215 RepID=A0A6G6Y153_9SPHN|nr:hypothetical protein [Sphingosinithalassobacter tenebrarum]QIG78652.1 hypothetical protein G5C33_01855 [Sphingosinithalassobacter tenebrarum]